MRLPVSVVVVVSAVLFSACGQSMLARGWTVRVRRGSAITEENLRGDALAATQRAVEDLACPVDDLMLVDLGSRGYRVEGCGEWYSYACVRETCVPAERGQLPVIATASTWGDEHIAVVARRLQTEVMACVPNAPEGLVVGLRLSRTGRIVLRARGPVAPFTATAAACVDTRMESVSLRGDVEEGRDVSLVLRGGALVPAVQTLESTAFPSAQD